ncbi:MAG: HAMP domain-containing sensor histidine kinase [Lachnospiraceae bacterium]|nr:HAMP domain-containing sensor histidine kinase [Lachnospiraceae bacterium]
MIKKKIAGSLSLQLLSSAIFSLLLAGIAFFGLYIESNKVLDQTVYGDAFMSRMSDRRFESLRDYVAENSISEEQIPKLNEWCKRVGHVYLVIYKEGDLLFTSAVPRNANAEERLMHSIEDESSDKRYELPLADGTETDAFLYYFTGDGFYYSTIIISGIAAFIIFSLVFISLINHKLRYIKRLKSELDILAGGDLQHEVNIIGEDELGELAFGIDQMRSSILQHQQVEEEIRSSNSQLVTAMSHDLRSPLTSLLAYLELLERGKYQDEEQMKHFIDRSLSQAMRIKTMADQLFEYFLVYSTDWEAAETETAEAGELFRQVIGEYIYSLESQNYQVQEDLQPLQGDVAVNLDLIRRVLDNLYSNLLKYAERSEPIHFSLCEGNGEMILKISNTVSAERSERESTNLGLNTCRKIMSYHRGSFETKEEDGIYTATLRLPLHHGSGTN